MMKERPGVMLYFDNADCIEELPDAEAGLLLKGVMHYGLAGLEPQFNGALKLVWLMLKPKLDRDAERYFRACRQKSYAVYCRERNKKGLEKPTFAEWEAEQAWSDDIDCDPTTAPSVTPERKITASLSAAVTVPRATDAEERLGLYGEAGSIRLTDAAYGELMDEIGLFNLVDTIRYAEPKAAALGLDAEQIDWKHFLRHCWYDEVKPKKKSPEAYFPGRCPQKPLKNYAKVTA